MEYKSKKSKANEIPKAEDNTAAICEKNISNDEIFVNDAEKEKDFTKIEANNDKNKEKRKFFYFYFPIIVIGIGIGWLIGLSVSPVLNIILTGLITILASILTVLSGISKPNATSEDTIKDTIKDTNLVTSKIINVNLFPLMWLVIGIVSGSVSGIYTRNHDLIKMNEYSKYDGSISKEDFGKLLLCRDFPSVECKIYVEGFTSATPNAANIVTKNPDENSATISNSNSKNEQETNISNKALSSISQSKVKVEVIPKSDSQLSKVTKNDEPKKESTTTLYPNRGTATPCEQISGESLETLKSAMKRVSPRNKLNEFAETCEGTNCFIKARQICPDLKLRREEYDVQK